MFSIIKCASYHLTELKVCVCLCVLGIFCKVSIHTANNPVRYAVCVDMGMKSCLQAAPEELDLNKFPRLVPPKQHPDVIRRSSEWTLI